MDDEEINDEVTIEPRLHDRWSLLTLVTAFAADVAQTVADNFASAAVMSVEHAKQKHIDRKFERIARDNSGTGSRSRFIQ